MAFPAVAGSATGVSGTSDSTSHSISALSSVGTISAGDLLLVIFSCDENTGDAADITVSINAGVSGNNWNIGGQVGNGNFNVNGSWFWKIAEGSDVLTLTTNTGQQSSHAAYRITGGYSVTGTSAGSTGGSNSNPPSHTPPDGTQDYLWIATRSGDNTVVATVAPSSFSNLLTQAASGASGASTNTAERQLNASSLDPGTFTSATEQWVSWTLAISPVLPGQPANLRTKGYMPTGFARVGRAWR